MEDFELYKQSLSEFGATPDELNNLDEQGFRDALKTKYNGDINKLLRTVARKGFNIYETSQADAMIRAAQRSLAGKQPQSTPTETPIATPGAQAQPASPNEIGQEQPVIPTNPINQANPLQPVPTTAPGVNDIRGMVTQTVPSVPTSAQSSFIPPEVDAELRKTHGDGYVKKAYELNKEIEARIGPTKELLDQQNLTVSYADVGRVKKVFPELSYEDARARALEDKKIAALTGGISKEIYQENTVQGRRELEEASLARVAKENGFTPTNTESKKIDRNNIEYRKLEAEAATLHDQVKSGQITEAEGRKRYAAIANSLSYLKYDNANVENRISLGHFENLARIQEPALAIANLGLKQTTVHEAGSSQNLSLLKQEKSLMDKLAAAKNKPPTTSADGKTVSPVAKAQEELDYFYDKNGINPKKGFWAKVAEQELNKAKATGAVSKTMIRDVDNLIGRNASPQDKLKLLLLQLDSETKELDKRFGFSKMGEWDKIRANPEDNHYLKKYYENQATIRALSPLVLDIPSYDPRSEQANFIAAFGQGFFKGGWQAQRAAEKTTPEKKDIIAQSLIRSGALPEDSPLLKGLKGQESDMTNFVSETLGQSIPTMAGILGAAVAGNVAGGIARAVRIGQGIPAALASLEASGAGGKAVATILQSTANYAAAGQALPNIGDEANAISGIAGGVGTEFAGALGVSLSRFLKGAFGSLAAKAAEKVGKGTIAVAKEGVKRGVGGAAGELSEETFQSLAQLWQESANGQDFLDNVERQFGTVSKATRFALSTMILGGGMALVGGVGGGFKKVYKDAYKEVPKEEQDIVDEIAEQIAPAAQAITTSNVAVNVNGNKYFVDSNGKIFNSVTDEDVVNADEIDAVTKQITNNSSPLVTMPAGKNEFVFTATKDPNSPVSGMVFSISNNDLPADGSPVSPNVVVLDTHGDPLSGAEYDAAIEIINTANADGLPYSAWQGARKDFQAKQPPSPEKQLEQPEADTDSIDALIQAAGQPSTQTQTTPTQAAPTPFSGQQNIPTAQVHAAFAPQEAPEREPIPIVAANGNKLDLYSYHDEKNHLKLKIPSDANYFADIEQDINGGWRVRQLYEQKKIEVDGAPQIQAREINKTPKTRPIISDIEARINGLNERDYKGETYYLNADAKQILKRSADGKGYDSVDDATLQKYFFGEQAQPAAPQAEVQPNQPIENGEIQPNATQGGQEGRQGVLTPTPPIETEASTGVETPPGAPAAVETKQEIPIHISDRYSFVDAKNSPTGKDGFWLWMDPKDILNNDKQEDRIFINEEDVTQTKLDELSALKNDVNTKPENRSKLKSLVDKMTNGQNGRVVIKEPARFAFVEYVLPQLLKYGLVIKERDAKNQTTQDNSKERIRKQLDEKKAREKEARDRAEQEAAEKKKQREAKKEAKDKVEQELSVAQQNARDIESTTQRGIRDEQLFGGSSTRALDVSDMLRQRHIDDLREQADKLKQESDARIAKLEKEKKEAERRIARIKQGLEFRRRAYKSLETIKEKNKEKERIGAEQQKLVEAQAELNRIELETAQANALEAERVAKLNAEIETERLQKEQEQKAIGETATLLAPATNVSNTQQESKQSNSKNTSELNSALGQVDKAIINVKKAQRDRLNKSPADKKKGDELLGKLENLKQKISLAISAIDSGNNNDALAYLDSAENTANGWEMATMSIRIKLKAFDASGYLENNIAVLKNVADAIKIVVADLSENKPIQPISIAPDSIASETQHVPTESNTPTSFYPTTLREFDNWVKEQPEYKNMESDAVNENGIGAIKTGSSTTNGSAKNKLNSLFENLSKLLNPVNYTAKQYAYNDEKKTGGDALKITKNIESAKQYFVDIKQAAINMRDVMAKSKAKYAPQAVLDMDNLISRADAMIAKIDAVQQQAQAPSTAPDSIASVIQTAPVENKEVLPQTTSAEAGYSQALDEIESALNNPDLKDRIKTLKYYHGQIKNSWGTMVAANKNWIGKTKIVSDELLNRAKDLYARLADEIKASKQKPTPAIPTEAELAELQKEIDAKLKEVAPEDRADYVEPTKQTKTKKDKFEANKDKGKKIEGIPKHSAFFANIRGTVTAFFTDRFGNVWHNIGDEQVPVDEIQYDELVRIFTQSSRPPVYHYLGEQSLARVDGKKISFQKHKHVWRVHFSNNESVPSWLRGLELLFIGQDTTSGEWRRGNQKALTGSERLALDSYLRNREGDINLAGPVIKGVAQEKRLELKKYETSYSLQDAHNAQGTEKMDTPAGRKFVQGVVRLLNKAFPDLTIHYDYDAFLAALRTQAGFDFNQALPKGFIDQNTGNIYLNPRALTPDTPIHEVAHMFVRLIAQKSPKLYASLIAETKANTALMDKVRALYPDLSEDALAEEAAVTAIGLAGAKALKDVPLSEKLKQKINALLDWVRTKFGIAAKDFDWNSSISDFLKKGDSNTMAVARVMLAGKQISKGIAPKAGNNINFSRIFTPGHLTAILEKTDPKTYLADLKSKLDPSKKSTRITNNQQWAIAKEYLDEEAKIPELGASPTQADIQKMIDAIEARFDMVLADSLNIKIKDAAKMFAAQHLVALEMSQLAESLQREGGRTAETDKMLVASADMLENAVENGTIYGQVLQLHHSIQFLSPQGLYTWAINRYPALLEKNGQKKYLDQTAIFLASALNRINKDALPGVLKRLFETLTELQYDPNAARTQADIDFDTVVNNLAKLLASGEKIDSIDPAGATLPGEAEALKKEIEELKKLLGEAETKRFLEANESYEAGLTAHIPPSAPVDFDASALLQKLLSRIQNLRSITGVPSDVIDLDNITSYTDAADAIAALFDQLSETLLFSLKGQESANKEADKAKVLAALFSGGVPGSVLQSMILGIEQILKQIQAQTAVDSDAKKDIAETLTDLANGDLEKGLPDSINKILKYTSEIFTLAAQETVPAGPPAGAEIISQIVTAHFKKAERSLRDLLSELQKKGNLTEDQAHKVVATVSREMARVTAARQEKILSRIAGAEVRILQDGTVVYVDDRHEELVAAANKTISHLRNLIDALPQSPDAKVATRNFIESYMRAKFGMTGADTHKIEALRKFLETILSGKKQNPYALEELGRFLYETAESNMVDPTTNANFKQAQETFVNKMPSSTSIQAANNMADGLAAALEEAISAKQALQGINPALQTNKITQQQQQQAELEHKESKDKLDKKRTELQDAAEALREARAELSKRKAEAEKYNKIYKEAQVGIFPTGKRNYTQAEEIEIARVQAENQADSLIQAQKNVDAAYEKWKNLLSDEQRLSIEERDALLRTIKTAKELGRKPLDDAAEALREARANLRLANSELKKAGENLKDVHTSFAQSTIPSPLTTANRDKVDKAEDLLDRKKVIQELAQKEADAAYENWKKHISEYQRNVIENKKTLAETVKEANEIGKAAMDAAREDMRGARKDLELANKELATAKRKLSTAKKSGDKQKIADAQKDVDAAQIIVDSAKTVIEGARANYRALFSPETRAAFALQDTVREARAQTKHILGLAEKGAETNAAGRQPGWKLSNTAQMATRLIKMSNMVALDAKSPVVQNALTGIIGFPMPNDPVFQATVAGLVSRIQGAPDGFSKDHATRELQAYLADMASTKKFFDYVTKYITPFRYALGLLSGMQTQGNNLFWVMPTIFFDQVGGVLFRPKQIVNSLKMISLAWEHAVTQGAAAYRGLELFAGEGHNVGVFERETNDILQNIPAHANPDIWGQDSTIKPVKAAANKVSKAIGWLYLRNKLAGKWSPQFARFVGNVMRSGDAFTSTFQTDMFHFSRLRYQLEQNAKKDPSINPKQELAKVLEDYSQGIVVAKAEANQEVTAGKVDARYEKSRAWEILIEKLRSPEDIDISVEQGRKVVGQGKNWAAERLNAGKGYLSRKYTDPALPFNERVAWFAGFVLINDIVPFIATPLNLVWQQATYMGTPLPKLIKSGFGWDKNMDTYAKVIEMRRANQGLAIMASFLLYLLITSDDEDDRWFEIRGGSGKPNTANEKQMYERYAIIIRDGKEKPVVYNISDTGPFALLFSWMGNFSDDVRKTKREHEQNPEKKGMPDLEKHANTLLDILGSAFAATWQSGEAIKNQTFLKGISDFVDMIRNNEDTGGQKMIKWLSKIINQHVFAPVNMNIVTQFLRGLNNTLPEPIKINQKWDKTITPLFLSTLPMIGSFLGDKNKYNVFGDPLTAPKPRGFSSLGYGPDVVLSNLYDNYHGSSQQRLFDIFHKYDYDPRITASLSWPKMRDADSPWQVFDIEGPSQAVYYQGQFAGKIFKKMLLEPNSDGVLAIDDLVQEAENEVRSGREGDSEKMRRFASGGAKAIFAEKIEKLRSKAGIIAKKMVLTGYDHKTEDWDWKKIEELPVTNTDVMKAMAIQDNELNDE